MIVSQFIKTLEQCDQHKSVCLNGYEIQSVKLSENGVECNINPFYIHDAGEHEPTASSILKALRWINEDLDVTIVE